MDRLVRLLLPGIVISVLAADATAATVTIKASRLRSSSITAFVWSLTGPGVAINHDGDATLVLGGPAEYEIFIPGGQPYGRFTVDAADQVVNPTGALTVSGSVVDFRLEQLAAVAIPVERLSSNPANAGAVLGLVNISGLIVGNSPVFYMPPSLPGQSYWLTSRAGHGTFGTFTVNADLTLGSPTGSLILVTDGDVPRLDFDLSRLAAVHFPPFSDLWEPDSAASLVNYSIAELASIFRAATLWLPPNTLPSHTYLLHTRSGVGRFGTFHIDPDLQITNVTGALQFAREDDGSWRMAFDHAGLASLHFNLRPLVQPFSGVFTVHVIEEGNLHDDVTIALPPNAPNTRYTLFTVNPSSIYGTVTVAPDLSVATTGALRLGTDGRTIDFDLCSLNGLTITPAEGTVGLLQSFPSSGINWVAAVVSTTIHLPDGTYTVLFHGAAPPNSIVVTLAGGIITNAMPDVTLPGGSVSIAPCDTTPPALTLPPNAIGEATSPEGAEVVYTVNAIDDVDPNPVVSCSPPSGDTFPLGTTTVSCSATDAAGNSSSGSFTVTVRDITAQIIQGNVRAIQHLVEIGRLQAADGERLQAALLAFQDQLAFLGVWVGFGNGGGGGGWSGGGWGGCCSFGGGGASGGSGGVDFGSNTGGLGNFVQTLVELLGEGRIERGDFTDLLKQSLDIALTVTDWLTVGFWLDLGEQVINALASAGIIDQRAAEELRNAIRNAKLFFSVGDVLNGVLATLDWQNGIDALIRSAAIPPDIGSLLRNAITQVLEKVGEGSSTALLSDLTTDVGTLIGSGALTAVVGNQLTGGLEKAAGLLVVGDHRKLTYEIDTLLMLARTSGQSAVLLPVTEGLQELQARVGRAASPEEQIRVVMSIIGFIIEINPGTVLADKLEDVEADGQKALAELTKMPPDNQGAVQNLKKAVDDLERTLKKDLLNVTYGVLLMRELTRSAWQLAADAILTAGAQGRNPKLVDKARAALAEGDDLEALGMFKRAVDKYKDALAKAEGAH